MSFRKQNLMNFQIQLTKRQGRWWPMTRDYIARERSETAPGVEHGQRAATADRRRIERLIEIPWLSFAG